MVIKWWQLIVVGLIVYLIGGGTGYLFHRAPTIIASPTITIPGKPDTVKIEVPTTNGSHTYWPVHTDHSVDSVRPFPISSFLSFTKTTDSVQNGIHFIFRSTTYPYMDSTGRMIDSAQIIHEWHIIPAPAHIITRVDTIKVTMSPVSVPEPFFTKPGFMFSSGVVVGIAVTIYLIKGVLK